MAKDRKPNPIGKIFLSISLFLLSAAALAVTFFLFKEGLLYVHPSDEIASAAQGEEERLSADLSEKLNYFTNNTASTALENLTYIPRIYTIDENAPGGELPDPAAFGASDDPRDVEAVIASASALLGGEPTVWNRNLPFWEGTETKWYYDETILVLCWTELTDNTLCYCSEVKVADASQFRRALAGDSYGSGRQLRCSDMAAQANAVLASNADFYSYRGYGINIYKGKLYRCYPGVENCMIDGNGNILVTHADELTTEEEAKAYMEEKDIRFSLSFGPILIENGVPITSCNYSLGQVDSVAARAALCQMGERHYLLMNANYTTIMGLVSILKEKEPMVAYALDGGQTGETILGGEILNEIVYHSERNVSDCIYFATAYPFEGEKK